MLQTLQLPVILTVCLKWLVTPKGKMFMNGHIFFSHLKDIFKLLQKLQGRQLKGREGRKILPLFADTHDTPRNINIYHCWKVIQINLPFISRQCQKSSENAWLSMSLFLPTQDRQGHVGLQTSWSFFDLLGYFAAHCPAVENHGGTRPVTETLFSQVPWEKKCCVKPMKRRVRRGRLNLFCLKILTNIYSKSKLASMTKSNKQIPTKPRALVGMLFRFWRELKV